MLNHIRNSKAGRKNYEVVTNALYRVTFIPPASVSGSEILSEQCISITGWRRPQPEAVQQQANQSRRNYASVDVDHTQNLTATFELNLNEANQNYVFDTMEQWANLVANPFTGTRGLKRNYIGTIIVEQHNPEGDIYWTRKIENAWISGDFAGLGENDVTAADPARLDVNIIGDYYDQVKA